MLGRLLKDIIRSRAIRQLERDVAVDQVFEPRTGDFKLNENDSLDVQMGKVIASGRCPECGHKRLLEQQSGGNGRPEFAIRILCGIPTCRSTFWFVEVFPSAERR
jgi:hypothetical protein